MALWVRAPNGKSPSANFGGHRLRESGDVMDLVCNVFLQNHVIEESVDFIDHPTNFGGHRLCGSGDMMVFIFK